MNTKLSSGLRILRNLVFVAVVGILCQVLITSTTNQYVHGYYDEKTKGYSTSAPYVEEEQKELQKFFSECEWVTAPIGELGTPDYIIVKSLKVPKVVNNTDKAYKVYYQEDSSDIIVVSEKGYTVITVWGTADIYPLIKRT